MNSMWRFIIDLMFRCFSNKHRFNMEQENWREVLYLEILGQYQTQKLLLFLFFFFSFRKLTIQIDGIPTFQNKYSFFLPRILEKIQITKYFFFDFSSLILAMKLIPFILFEREKFKMLLTNPGQFSSSLRQSNLFLSQFFKRKKKKIPI